MALPHPRYIRTWYSKINEDHGFTRCAFAALAAQVKVDTAKNRGTICTLMLDEMAIRKHIQFGFVDVGNGQQDDSAPMAKDALVLMVVSVNASWKIPVAYFLMDGMSGPERANVIRECLLRLHATGVQVVSLTCDGPSCHFSMFNDIGADLSLNTSTFQTSFPHPSDTSIRVNILLDACHMLKLVRNTLVDRGVLFAAEGGRISWGFIESLNTLQEEGLRLGESPKEIPHTMAQAEDDGKPCGTDIKCQCCRCSGVQ